MVSGRASKAVLLAAVVTGVVLGAAALFRCASPSEPAQPGTLTFSLGQQQEAFFPWQGKVAVSTLEARPGGQWAMDYDFSVDMRNLRLRPDRIKGLALAVVGEPVFDQQGKALSLTATSFSTAFTTTGVPLARFPGTLPVLALGSRHGSPLEAVVKVPAGAWTRGGRARVKGRLSLPIPKDLPPGFYRPHVDFFALFEGSNTPISLGHLAAVLNISDTPWDKLVGGFWDKYLRRPRPSDSDFMDDPQVLPMIKVGNPNPPRIPWTIFHQREVHGMSGLLPVEDSHKVGLLNRVHLPRALRLSPGRYRVNPGLPSLAPRGGLSGMFVDRGGPDIIDKHYLDLSRGSAEATLRGPGGRSTDLGRQSFAHLDRGGVMLSRGGFDPDLSQTGDYELRLRGEMYDVYGRRFTAGGTYRFTVARPLSFSTAAKAGTNYLQGASFPAVMHINPGVPAQVRMEAVFYPGSDPSRKQRVLHQGRANNRGHFVAAQPWLKLSEPGEYRSRFEARYLDAAGHLWMGAQASSGVVAPQEPAIVLHGGKTRLAADPSGEPRARFQGGLESTCDPRYEPPLPGDDFLIPYHSGDTLFSAVTYPFESTISNVLSTEVRSPDLARRLARAYTPRGKAFNYPEVSHGGEVSFHQGGVRFSLDDRGAYKITADQPQQMPVLFANRRGLSPFLFAEHNDIEAYVYLSVIRPGFMVLSLAFSESHLQPYWVVSPGMEGEVPTRPVGDLAGDIYRVMAGLVVKDRANSRLYYDAYASAIANIDPGFAKMSVSAPGERPLVVVNGRPQHYFMGMDTSVIYNVGDLMVLAGTVMPPVAAEVSFSVTNPGNEKELIRGRSNRLGQFSPPRPVKVDQPGVYRVRCKVEKDGKSGDILGSGDGEFFNFALPAGAPRLLRANLRPISRAGAEQDIRIPLSWPKDLREVKLTHSLNMPGFVLDEGQRSVKGHTHDFILRLDQLAVQYPFLEILHHGTGRPDYVDTVVVVLFMEATQGGKNVYDALRLIFRRGMLLNPRALFPARAAEKPPGNLFPKNRTFFADP